MDPLDGLGEHAGQRHAAALHAQQHEIVDALRPQAGDTVLNKTTMGAFASTGIDARLRALGVSTVLVVGVSTNNCVAMTAMEAADRQYGMVIVSDATGTDNDGVSIDGGAIVRTTGGGAIDIDGMSSRSAWHERISGMPRRMSTNHFMGPGYWIWFIPLPGDRTSVGIVADPSLHPFETFRDYDSCLAWLAREQPLCAQALAASGDAPMDFRYLRGFSHDCKRLWSSEGWGLTGEAGVFADPFYSPGADFIALSNTFLTEIVGRSLRGDNVRAPALIYEQLYKSFYWTSMSIYQGQYPGFGDSRLMALKSTWDYAYYWGVLALLYVSGGMTDLDTMRRLEPTLVGLQKMHRDMQSEFRAVAARGVQSPGRGRFFLPAGG